MDKLYEKIYRRIHLKTIAAILTVIYFVQTYIKYCIKSFKNSIPSELSLEKANKRISDIYNTPVINTQEFTYTMLEHDPRVDLSIIVPAYNVADYVIDCLDSICNQQTGYAFEVIVVNDGSTDSTEVLLEEYQKNHDIRLYKQENQGNSVARNRGIEIAYGKYILFVDSDDLLLPGAIENLLHMAVEANADIVQGSYYRFSGKRDYYQEFIIPERELDKKSKDIDYIMGFPWGKIYKRDLWKKVRYPVGCWFEDTVVKCIVLYLADKVMTCNKLVYAYRVNEKGLSFDSKKKVKALDVYYVIEKIFASAYQNNIFINYNPYFCEWFYKVQITGLLWNRIQFFEDEIKESIFIMTADMIVRYGLNCTSQNRLTQKINKSFCEHNYEKWKIYAQYLSYRV
jgi:glycosyltransferase involved in cell wall biosynthesis